MLGETPQQTRRVQVPLEAEQPVDPSFRSRAAICGPTPEPCCAGGRAQLDMTSLKVQGLSLYRAMITQRLLGSDADRETHKQSPLTQSPTAERCNLDTHHPSDALLLS